MPAVSDSRVIKGSNYVANVLFSAEVSSLFLWDVPGVESFTALRTDLLVLKRTSSRDGITVCLLAIERLSNKHRLIDLWENPPCFGNSANALTSRGRDQGPERMRMLFSAAAMAQAFYDEVTSILREYGAERVHNSISTTPTFSNVPNDAPGDEGSEGGTGTSPPPRSPSPRQAAAGGLSAKTRISSSSEQIDALGDEGSEGGTPPTRFASSPLPQLIQATVESPYQEACCSMSIKGCPIQQVKSAIMDELGLLRTTVDQLAAARVHDQRIHIEERTRLEAAIISLSTNVAALTESVSQSLRPVQLVPQELRQAVSQPYGTVATGSHAQESHDTADLEASSHVPPQAHTLKRRRLEDLFPHIPKRSRTSAYIAGSSTAMTLLMYCASGQDLTTVRFGPAEWTVDVHQLRAQVYVIGKAAWDSVVTLYATLRSVSRDEEEPGYARLEFPSRALAEIFVEAWATHRFESEEPSWAQARALIA